MDKIIMKILKEWKIESGLKEPIRFSFSRFGKDKGTLYIYASQLGTLIGNGGSTYNKYADKLRDEFPNIENLKISLQEVSSFWA